MYYWCPYGNKAVENFESIISSWFNTTKGKDAFKDIYYSLPDYSGPNLDNVVSSEVFYVRNINLNKLDYKASLFLRLGSFNLLNTKKEEGLSELKIEELYSKVVVQDLVKYYYNCSWKRGFQFFEHEGSKKNETF